MSVGNHKPSPGKTRTFLSCFVNIMVAGDLATQGGWASATMVLTYISWNIPVPAGVFLMGIGVGIMYHTSGHYGLYTLFQVRENHLTCHGMMNTWLCHPHCISYKNHSYNIIVITGHLIALLVYIWIVLMNNKWHVNYICFFFFLIWNDSKLDSDECFVTNYRSNDDCYFPYWKLKKVFTFCCYG